MTRCADTHREQAIPISVPPPFYSSETFHGRVVDTATGQHIAGAVIVCIWRKVGTHTEQWSGVFHLAETATGERGQFTIPRWGPRPSPQEAFLDKRDPEIWVIRRGYLVGYFDNSGESKPVMPKGNDAPNFVKLPPAKMLDFERGAYARVANGVSVWNGRILRLSKAPSPDDAARSLAASNPGDPRLPPRFTPLPLYWAEWEKAKALLPPDTQRVVPFPPHSIIDYDVTP